MSVPIGGFFVPVWLARVQQEMQRAGVPWPVWVSIAWEESSLNPFAHNTGTPSKPEDSVGLFQLNRNGGQGSGHSVQELQDPVTNAIIAARYIGPAVKQCGVDNIECIAVNSGHPGQVPTSDNRVQRIKRTYNFISGKDFTTALTTLMSGVPLPSVPTLPGLPNLGSLNPVEIGRGIVQGITSTVFPGLVGFTTMSTEDKIKALAPATGIVAGVWLIGIGLFGAALKSPPAKSASTAASVSPNPYVRGAGVAVGQSQRLFS